MQIPPVDVILSWPTPNYDHPETRGLTLLILMVIFTVLVLLSCLGRFYSRIIVKRWFGWDDGFIIIALVSLQHNTACRLYLFHVHPMIIHHSC